MPAMVDEARVWKFVPPEVNRPANVSIDGKGGVTTARFNEFIGDATRKASTYLLARYNIEMPTGDGLLDPDIDVESLKDAVACLTAGYMFRLMRNYQDLMQNLFAQAFATLDEWGTAVQRKEGVVAGPKNVEDDFDAGFPVL